MGICAAVIIAVPLPRVSEKHGGGEELTAFWRPRLKRWIWRLELRLRRDRITATGPLHNGS
ncbi:hypothetical protein E2C01_057934 [Portunus trituberculatus]|uniref:Uncharacterized protein n=1 Tax=Portunus trituberculatus TaxID=210409 RepID=A0A5B7H1P3_PORTR|nr:hypothetical protein [Portunus trituberculatus]